MNPLFLILLATFLVSLGGLIGVFTLSLNHKKLHSFLLTLVSLSAGALMGGAFLHLLPEALSVLPGQLALSLTLYSFIGFFLIEKIFHWRHCHQEHCKIHAFGYLNLLGDSLHNFIDGLIIAGAFLANPHLGWITTLAIALHEIPQEIGDFGVLLYSGWSQKRALIANFGVALTAVFGGLTGYYLAGTVSLTQSLLPLAAGGFIYIAASDLLPELKKETRPKKILVNFLFFILGVLLMFIFKD
ncbi:MAG: ZIP family metal transporter [Candidatus Beckwithbacteria bacterium]